MSLGNIAASGSCFLPADATLPRVLDVNQLIATREAEIEVLLNGLDHSSEHPVGRAALPNHLRRRATSHKCYSRKRRPNAKLVAAGKRQKLGGPNEPMVAAGRPTNRTMRRRPARLQAQIEEVCLQDDGQAAPGHVRKLETHVWHARRMKMTERFGHALALHVVGRGHGSRAFLAAADSGSVLHDASYWSCLELRGLQAQLVQVLNLVSDPSSIQSLVEQAEVWCGAVEWQIHLHACGCFPTQLLGPVKAMFFAAAAHGSSSAQQTTEHHDQDMITDKMQSASSLQQQPANDSGTRLDGTDSKPHADSTVALWLWVHAAALESVSAALKQAVDTAAFVSPRPATDEDCKALMQSVSLHDCAADITMQPVTTAPCASPGQPASPAPRVALTHRTDLRRLELAGKQANSTLANVIMPAPASSAGYQTDPAQSSQGQPECTGNKLWGAYIQHVCAHSNSTGRPTQTSKKPEAKLPSKPLTTMAQALHCMPGASRAIVKNGAHQLRPQHGQIPPGVNLELPAPATKHRIKSLRKSGHQRFHVKAPSGNRTLQASTANADSQTALQGSCSSSRTHAAEGNVQRMKVDSSFRWDWPEAAVLGVTAWDPRVLRPVSAGDLQIPGPSCVGDCGCLSHQEVQDALEDWPDSGDWTDSAAALFHFSQLSKPSPPLTEAELSAARQSSRNLGLQLPSNIPTMNSTTTSVTTMNAAVPSSTSNPLNVASNLIDTTAGSACDVAPQSSQSSVACPVLLVQQQHGQLSGWSIILPAHWVMPFWLALVFQGVRVAGQEEWRWLAAHTHRPCFPYDYPETPAGQEFLRQQRAELTVFANKRPAGRVDVSAGPLTPWYRLGMQSDASRDVAPDRPKGKVKQQKIGLQKQTSQRKPTATIDAASQAVQGMSISSVEAAMARAESEDVDLPDADTLAAGQPQRSTVQQHQQHHVPQGVAQHSDPGVLPKDAFVVVSSYASLLQMMASTFSATAGQPVGGDGNNGVHDKSAWTSLGRAIDKALGRGLMIWQPVSQRVALSTSAAHENLVLPQIRSPLAPPADCASTMATTNKARCLVRVMLKVVGKGVCKEGAEVCLNLCEGTSVAEVTRSLPGGSTHTTRNESRGQSMLASTLHSNTMQVDGSDCMPDSAILQEQKAQPAQMQTLRTDSPRIIGFVTSTFPRGARGYPGAIALCDAACIWKARSNAFISRQFKSQSNVKVLLRNPGCQTYRVCSAHILLEDGEGFESFL